MHAVKSSMMSFTMQSAKIEFGKSAIPQAATLAFKNFLWPETAKTTLQFRLPQISLRWRDGHFQTFTWEHGEKKYEKRWGPGDMAQLGVWRKFQKLSWYDSNYCSGIREQAGSTFLFLSNQVFCWNLSGSKAREHLNVCKGHGDSITNPLNPWIRLRQTAFFRHALPLLRALSPGQPEVHVVCCAMRHTKTDLITKQAFVIYQHTKRHSTLTDRVLS